MLIAHTYLGIRPTRNDTFPHATPRPYVVAFDYETSKWYTPVYVCRGLVRHVSQALRRLKKSGPQQYDRESEERRWRPRSPA